MKILIVESEFLHQDTWVGTAVARLAEALRRQNVEVMQSTSLDDGSLSSPLTNLSAV